MLSAGQTDTTAMRPSVPFARLDNADPQLLEELMGEVEVFVQLHFTTEGGD